MAAGAQRVSSVQTTAGDNAGPRMTMARLASSCQLTRFMSSFPAGWNVPPNMHGGPGH